MKTTAVVAIAVGAALLTVAAAQLHSSRQLQARLAAMQLENQQLQSSLDRQDKLRSVLEAEIRQLRERVELAAPPVQPASSAQAASNHGQNVNDGQIDPLPRARYQTLVRNLTDPGVAEQMAQARVQRKYGQLLDSFNLSRNRRMQAERIIVTTTAQRNVASLKAIMGEFEDDDLPDLLNARHYEQLMLQRLSAVLDPQQLAQVKTLRQTDEERRLRETYDATTKKQAKGLSERNRQLLVDAIVNEMLRDSKAQRRPRGGNDYDPVRSISRQTDSLAKVGRQLEGVLSAEQMDVVNRYLRQQIEQLHFTASLWKDQSAPRE